MFKNQRKVGIFYKKNKNVESMFYTELLYYLESMKIYDLKIILF